MQKLLPPRLFLAFAVLIALVSLCLPQTQTIAYPLNLAGLPLLILGLSISIWHSRLFRRRNTNINTFNQPDVMVKDCLFRHTRNPMYLGFVVALLGVAVLSLGSLFGFALVIGFVVITDRWYIRFEEQAMRDTFGEAYDEYCQEVRRWV